MAAKRKQRSWSDSNKTDSVRSQVVRNAEVLSTGIVLCIDPSSGSSGSNAGYAVFNCGRLVESGTIFKEAGKNRLSIYDRLRELADWMAAHDYADVLVMEKIRGKSHTYLRWACGVVVATCRAPVVIEISPILWHKFTPSGYVKSDERDAVMFGDAVFEILREELAK